jgi:ATP-dependent DNA helicase RecG
MSDVIDLKQLAVRESEQIEWKENVADIDNVVGTLSAFANDLANLGGGYVICGAREDKDAHGFPVLIRTGLASTNFKEVENKVLARCRDRVSPPINPLIEELPSDVPERRILIFIQPATGQAHTFRPDKEGAKHYVRVSRSTIEARNGVRARARRWRTSIFSRCAMLSSAWACSPRSGVSNLISRPTHSSVRSFRRCASRSR